MTSKRFFPIRYLNANEMGPRSKILFSSYMCYMSTLYDIYGMGNISLTLNTFVNTSNVKKVGTDMLTFDILKSQQLK